MSRLSAAESQRVAAISDRLDTLRIGDDSAVADVMPGVRDLLGVDNAIVYSLREENEHLAHRVVA